MYRTTCRTKVENRRLSKEKFVIINSVTRFINFVIFEIRVVVLRQQGETKGDVILNLRKISGDTESNLKN